MMEIQDFINAANTLLKDKSSTLVLHRNIKVHPVIKIHKTYEYKLYLVTTNKDKTLLLESKFEKKTTVDDMLKTWNDCDKEYLPTFIKWLTTSDFTKWI